MIRQRPGKENFLNIALIGGMDRLKRHYIHEARKSDIDLKVFNTLEAGIASKIRSLDALVIFTNKISHDVKIQAMNAARSNNIPVLLSHSCGICSLRDCIECLKNESLSSSSL